MKWPSYVLAALLRSCLKQDPVNLMLNIMGAVLDLKKLIVQGK